MTRRKEMIFLFGAAEKGATCLPITLHTLDDLLIQLGNPPAETEGIHYAIQALLFHYGLIYYRVNEEGFSYGDYMLGLKWLKKAPLHPHLAAICLPGVGDEEIIQSATTICHQHQSLLIVSQKDLYDYLTV